MSFGPLTGMEASIATGRSASGKNIARFRRAVLPRPARASPGAHGNAKLGTRRASGRYPVWALALSAALHGVLFAVIGSAIQQRIEPVVRVSHEPVFLRVDLPSAVSSPPVVSHEDVASVRRTPVPRHAATVRRALANMPANVELATLPAAPVLRITAAAGETTLPDAPSSSTAASGSSLRRTSTAAGNANVGVPASTPPKYLDSPKPDYPQVAREDEEEGLVVLRVRISRDGAPAEIQLDRSSGFPLLDRAAMAAIRHWTFAAAVKSGRPIESWMQIPVRFRLQAP